MLTMAIWCVGTLAEVLVLVRGFQAKLFRRFPIFYAYLLFVNLDEFARFFVYRWHTSYYFQVYWVTQFFSLAIGSAIILEIYQVALRSYPGAAKMARYLLLVVFGAILIKALTVPSESVITWVAATSLVLERNLRIVQALAILTLVSLFFWYAIPFGRNLKGILGGYSLFIGISIIQITLLYHSWDLIKPFWTYAPSLSYLLVLGIWARTLWSSQPVPEARADIRLESDYELLVASTRDQFRRAVARLGWGVRA
jgi:hypothetical protein